MYAQNGNDNYETNSSHPNTDKTKLSATDSLEVGKSYWIITDDNVTVTLDETLSGIQPTARVDADSTFGISDPDFTEVNQTALPNNVMQVSGDVKKYMTGNVFPYAFNLRDLYFSHGGSSGTFHPMGDSANDTYISSTVYTHNSPDTSGDTEDNGGGYKALDPATPGFDQGSIRPMEGFFIKIEEDSSTDDNSFAFPLNMSNKL